MTMYNNGYYGYGMPFYGAVPDNLVQLRNGQATQPPMAQPAMPQPQSGNGLIWVQGETGAKSYLVAANSTVMLMDSEADVFYLKSADASGMPMPLRTFKYTEVTSNNNPQPQGVPAQAISAADLDRYVTREELNEILANISSGSGNNRKPEKANKEAVNNG